MVSKGPITSRLAGQVLVIEQDIVYKIDADAVDQNPNELLATPGLPVAKVTSNSDGMLCKGVSLSQNESLRTRWLATCSFSSDVKEGTDPLTPQQGDPVDWIPQAEIEWEFIDEYCRKDLDNKAYLNTAGDPFETGLVITRKIPVRVFTQFEPVGMYAPNWETGHAYRKGEYVTSGSNIYQAVDAGTSGATAPTGTSSTPVSDGAVSWKYYPSPVSGAVNLNQIEDRCNSMNETEFLGRAADTLLLEVRKAAIGWYYGYRRWRIDYAVKFNDQTWLHKQWSMGYRYLNVLDNSKEKFETGGVAFVGKLDENGFPVSDQATDDPYLISFRNFQRTEFKNFLRIV